MEKGSISEEEIRITEDYLKRYGLYGRLLRVSERDRRFYEDRGAGALPGEAALARANMFGVRQFIMGLENSDEKLLLYYHYVRGSSVEQCAELLGISRSSGFRLKKRALIMATARRLERGG